MTADISLLPENLLLVIFKYLNVQQVCLGIRRTCKQWSILSYDFSLWNHLDLRKFPNINDKDVVDVLSQIGIHIKHLNVSGCTKLSNLIFASQKISCPQLESINVIATSITHEGIMELMINVERFPVLNSVYCKYAIWDSENNFYQLCCDAYQVGRRLKCFSDPYENQPLSEVISISGIQEGLLHISALFSSLESVTISQTGIDCIPIESICKNNSNLQKLDIHDCLWAIDALDIAIGYTKNLLELDISNTPILDAVLVKIAEKCPNLQKLNVTGCRKITDVGLCKASEIWKDLQHLILNESKGTSGNVTDSGMRHLGENCIHLQEITACFCPSISDNGVEALAVGCPLLKYVDLTGCLALTDRSVFALANNCHYLEKLTASEMVQLTSDSVNELITKCVRLQTLELETCHYLTKLSFSNLNTSEMLHDTLGELNANDECHTVETTDMYPISCLIHSCLTLSPCRIRVLDLGFCSKIATDSVKQIASYCCMLQNLSLRGCYLVTDPGIEAVAVKCKLLQVLDLCASTTHHSKYTDSAVNVLADHAKNLVMLNLQKNRNISRDSVKNVIAKCNTLIRLGVSGKAVPIVDVIAFCKEKRGHCAIDGMNIAYLGPNSKNEYLIKMPALKLAVS